MGIKKIDESDISVIRDIINYEKETISKLGVIEYDLSRLEFEKKKALQTLGQLGETKKNKFEYLKEVYGEGNLNIDTGELTTIEELTSTK
jgi:hypothetical protein